MLYQALSGSRLFRGASLEAMLWAVIRDDVPALRTVAPATPRPVERCVMRCLEKDPRRRYQSAADLKLVLQDLRDDLVAADAAGFSAPSRSGQAIGVPLLSRLLYVGGGAALVAAAMTMRGAPTVTEPRFMPLVTEVASVATPTWAPDGQTLAYSSLADGDPQLYVRAVGSPQSTVLARASMLGPPFWAPDGSRLYFVRGNDRNLVSVSASGGEPQGVFAGDSDRGAALTGRASISPDGRFIIFGRGEVGAVELLDARPCVPRGPPHGTGGPAPTAGQCAGDRVRA